MVHLLLADTIFVSAFAKPTRYLTNFNMYQTHFSDIQSGVTVNVTSAKESSVGVNINISIATDTPDEQKQINVASTPLNQTQKQ